MCWEPQQVPRVQEASGRQRREALSLGRLRLTAPRGRKSSTADLQETPPLEAGRPPDAQEKKCPGNRAVGGALAAKSSELRHNLARCFWLLVTGGSRGGSARPSGPARIFLPAFLLPPHLSFLSTRSEAAATACSATAASAQPAAPPRARPLLLLLLHTAACSAPRAAARSLLLAANRPQPAPRATRTRHGSQHTCSFHTPSRRGRGAPRFWRQCSVRVFCFSLRLSFYPPLVRTLSFLYQ